ncbi:MAG TPA: penicillin-binding protein 2 [Methyloceanibacter sp.]|nr:penicillin-binding protein 2 [Methyloceanibacter sp.]
MRPRDYALKLRNRFSRRAVLIGAAQTGLFGLLLWRLRQLQILDSPEYQLLSDDNRISEHLVAPARGSIYDRLGRTIAEDRENFRVMIIPALCRDLGATLDAISEIVRVSTAARDRVMRAARRQSGYFPVLVTEGLDWRQFALLSVLAPQLAGMRTDRATYRRYVRASSMAHVVGYVGLADKEDVGVHPVMRVPGFRTGKAGIEKGLDAELRGEPGTISYEVDAHGRVVRELGATASLRGKDLVLTIDQELQEIAQKRIEGLRVASIVVLDALTGGIVVMASYPSFDPNEVSFKVDLKEWKELAKNVDHPLENRALRGQYPPGSTFKVVTALAGLEAGVITPEEHMTCPGGFPFGRHYFRCWKRHGSIYLHEAIKQSCDVYFYHTVNRVGIDRLAEMSRKLGLGQIHDIGLAGQKQGIIPDTKWKRSTFGQPWYPGETISCGIGQGYVSATPLQLAVVAARIATGREVRPHLIAPSTPEPEPASLAIDPVHLELVRGGMVGVVNEKGGTAVRSALTLPNVQMAGKTGTSQVISAKNRGFLKGWEGETHALFIAYAPAASPRYAAACVVEHGGGGSRAAAPVVRDVMTEVLLRDPALKTALLVSNEETAGATKERKR